jgi:hypothetical protein
MKKFSVATFVLIVVLSCGAGICDALASGPQLFVTDPLGNQILSVDGTTGLSSILFTGNAAFRPQAIVYGPDGKLYVSVPESNQILRLDANGTNFETVYSAAAGQPTAPQGLHFNGGMDLYFTTQGNSGTGVWKIANVGAIPSGGPFPAPVNVISLANVSTAGVAFGMTGNLLFVDQTGKRIMQALPPYTSAAALITSGLSSPVAVAVNSAGNIFVTDQGTISILRFGADGSAMGTYVNLGSNALQFNSFPIYMGFDLSDTLYLVTVEQLPFSTAAVWRVKPPGGNANLQRLVEIGQQCTSQVTSGCVQGSVGADSAAGIAVPPTSASLTLHYSPAVLKNFYGFGGDSIQITFLGSVLTGFDMVVTKTQVLPANLAQQLQNATVFPQGTTCIQYSHEGGFCDTYTISKGTAGSPAPVLNTDFIGQIQVKMGFFTQNQVQQPSLGHAPGNNLFIEDIIFNYVPLLTPTSDPGVSGNADSFSRFVPLNKPLVLTNGQAAFFCGFSSPVPPPPVEVFNLGSTVPVKFQLTTGPNCTGQFITDATARLSLVLVNGNTVTLEPVQPSSNANTLNFFRLSGHQYVYSLSTKGLPAGIYVITVWGDKFTPQTDSFRLQ